MRPKKIHLHELLYTEIVKSGTIRFASGHCSVQVIKKILERLDNVVFTYRTVHCHAR